MKHARILSLLFSAGLVAALAGCSENDGGGGGDGDGGGSEELTEITYTHSSAPTASFALFECISSEAGFWEDEGLDVTVESIDGGTAAMQSLQAGQSDIVDTGTSVILPANQASNDTPAFHTLVTGPFVFPAVLEESDLTEMSELEGRRLGVLSLSSGGIPYTEAMFAAGGGDPDTLEFIPVGTGAPAVAALESGEVDAIVFADTEYALIESRGTPLRFLKNQAIEETGFGVAFSARRDWLAENPETAGAFARAAAKAYVFADENPEAAIRMCWDLYPEMIPSDMEEDAALEEAMVALEARVQASGPVEGRIGYTTDGQVEAVIEQQVNAGVLEPGLTVDDVWTDEVNDMANDFDEEEVREFARSYEE